MKKLLETIRALGFTGGLWLDEPMGRHCSLKAGGKAACLAVPEDREELERLLRECEGRRIPWMVLGGGTNLLFPEGTWPGVAVRLGRGFSFSGLGGEGLLEAGAAVSAPRVLKETEEAGLSGFEFAAGIPGSLGGAVAMNSGTRDGEMGGVVTEVEVLSGGQGKGRWDWIPRKDLRFSYRRLELAPRAIITRVRLQLRLRTPEEVRARVAEFNERRKATQPQGLPSAGCWFKNPPGESAGRLIQEAGMKGGRVGGAQVSEVHANFLVNRGGATPEDFLALAEEVRRAVKERWGVELEEEVRVVGR